MASKKQATAQDTASDHTSGTDGAREIRHTMDMEDVSGSSAIAYTVEGGAAFAECEVGLWGVTQCFAEMLKLQEDLASGEWDKDVLAIQSFSRGHVRALERIMDERWKELDPNANEISAKTEKAMKAFIAERRASEEKQEMAAGDEAATSGTTDREEEVTDETPFCIEVPIKEQREMLVLALSTRKQMPSNKSKELELIMLSHGKLRCMSEVAKERFVDRYRKLDKETGKWPVWEESRSIIQKRRACSW